MTTVVNSKIKFTVRDYVATPVDKRYELLEGELLVAPSPPPNHQRITRRLLRWLSEFVEQRNLGEVFDAPLDVILSDYDVLQPDVLFISKERAGIIRDRIYGAPDLVVEVLSPGTEERDRVLKRTIYARYGVREYWLVDPQQESVEVLALEPEGFVLAAIYHAGEALTSPVLEGLALAVEPLFSTQGDR
ncbi:MAG: Uma2 family endonuclease [Chloroflexi bacterium]|nr:Uma2 family endonuclease [Chloroflexota bacterium]